MFAVRPPRSRTRPAGINHTGVQRGTRSTAIALRHRTVDGGRLATSSNFTARAQLSNCQHCDLAETLTPHEVRRSLILQDP